LQERRVAKICSSSDKKRIFINFLVSMQKGNGYVGLYITYLLEVANKEFDINVI
jgi:hypothetical protein